MTDIQIVRVNVGTLRAEPSQDPSFPGIDIEFIPEEKTESISQPRVLIETPMRENRSDPLRCLVWADKNSEDYTEEIAFS